MHKRDIKRLLEPVNPLYETGAIITRALNFYSLSRILRPVRAQNYVLSHKNLFTPLKYVDVNGQLFQVPQYQLCKQKNI